MPVAKITKRAVDSAVPGPSTFVLYDTELKGFGLRVTPGGAKSYVAEYRPRKGSKNKRRYTIGAANKITAEQARERAREIFADVVKDKDPAAELAAKRGTPAFKDYVETYLTEIRVKPSTKALYSISLRKHACDAFGATKLNAVTKAQIKQMHSKLGEDRPVGANRTLKAVAAVYTRAQADGFVPKGFNPAEGVQAFPETARERYLTTEELARLGSAIRKAETGGIEKRFDRSKPTAKHIPKSDTSKDTRRADKGRHVVLDQHAAAALRLLLFTGARLREILHLRWEHVDLERGLLLLPDSKTGRKTIVLSAPALAVLSSVPHVGAFVIASYGTRAEDEAEKPRADLKRPWALVSREAGLSGVRLHDLRHTNASVGAGLGLGLPIIGKLLGHKQAATTQRYAHLDADPLRKATNAIGATIDAALSGTGGGDVVALRRR